MHWLIQSYYRNIYRNLALS